MAYPAGRVDSSYVSSISFLNDREILSSLADATREKDFLDVMQLLGKTKEVGQEEYHHFENDWLFSTITVASKTGTGVNVDVVATLAAGNHTNTGKDSFPRVGDEVLVKSGKKGLVVAKNTTTAGAHTITIRPQVGQDLGAEIVAADLIAFPNTVAAEGTGSPEGRKSNFIKFLNNTMRLKNSFAITVDQAVTKLSINVQGKPYFMVKGQHDAFLSFQLSEAFALLTSTGGFYNAPDGTIKTTRGLDAEVRTNGIIHNVAGAAFALTDMRALNKKLDRANAPDEYHWYVGSELNSDVDDAIGNLEGIRMGAINYASFGSGSEKQRAIDLGFDSFRMYNRTYHKKKLKALNHQGVTWAADNFQWAKRGYMLPMAPVREEKTGSVLDRICVRFRKGDGYDLGYHEAWTGKFAPKGATNDISEARVHYEAHKGLQVVGAKDMIVVQ
jgi:hypothetical protein